MTTFRLQRPALFAVIALCVALFMPLGFGGDYATIRSGSVAALHGASPYNVAGYYSPLSVTALMLPFAALPERVGYALFTFALVFAFLTAYSRYARTWGDLVLAMLSAFTVFCVVYGNLDGFVLLALLIPAPWLALIVAMLKPQTGIVLAAYILWRVWRERGLVRAVMAVTPVALIYAVSIAAGMTGGSPIGAVWNISPFPWLVPIGAYLALQAFKRRDASLALAASVFVTPYAAPQSFVALLPAAMRDRRVLVGVFVLSYVVLVLFRLKVG